MISGQQEFFFLAGGQDIIFPLSFFITFSFFTAVQDFFIPFVLHAIFFFSFQDFFLNHPPLTPQR